MGGGGLLFIGQVPAGHPLLLTDGQDEEGAKLTATNRRELIQIRG